MGWSTIPKIITGVKALSKTGAKPVSTWKNKASIARIKASSFNYKEGITKAMKKMKDIK